MKRIAPSRGKNHSIQRLEEWLEYEVSRKDAAALKPLASTRTLGQRFGVSHCTVFRLLKRIEKERRVWRHANGRFYPALAGKILGRPKPLAVMLRRMLSWSSLCREVMEGFTDECGERERSMLWFHNKNLVIQDAPDTEARVVSAAKQRKLLEEFYLHHGDSVAGIFLDEIWKDDAIRDVFPSQLPVVNFFRPTRLPALGNVAADFTTGALLAMSHLLACGYDHIFLLDPLPGYEPAQLFMKAGREVYRSIAGRDLPPQQEVPLYDPIRRIALFHTLAHGIKRVGLICPEDNLSLSLARELRSAGVALGERHGLVSVMGTSAAIQGNLTCVSFDFRAIGHAAAAMLCGGESTKRLFPPTLKVGSSTVASNRN